MLGSFANYSQALEAGYKASDYDHFLVAQIYKKGDDIQHVYGV